MKFKVSRQYGGKVRGRIGTPWFDCLESVIVEANSPEEAIQIVQDEKFPNAGTDYKEEFFGDADDLTFDHGEYRDPCVTLAYEVEAMI